MLLKIGRFAKTNDKHKGDSMKLKLVATCLFGLEKLLGEEIDALGLSRIETMDGRVLFWGEEQDIPRANLCLRCAEHVFICIGSFEAKRFDDLFEGVRAMPWEEWIGKNDAFPVKGHCIRSGIHSVPDCQSIIKKAVAERLSGIYGIRWFPETETKYQIEFFLFKDTAYLMLDTSGIPLHKRGYRPQAGPAPIRETLAAALALTARPKEDVLFWDPMCGSGTIAIEAALILSGRAPGLGRTFAGETFARLPERMWREAREQVQAAVKTDARFEVYASDIDEDVLDLVYENALRAGVEEFMQIFSADVRTIQRPDCRGTIVCNPPYGERLMKQNEVETLYRSMGNHFSDWDPWHIYIITSHPEFERLYGRRADKIRKLYNGMIPCNLYQFFKPVRSDPSPRTQKRSFR